MKVFKHAVTVRLNGGQQTVRVRAVASLNTWTRKDGGFTVRSDGNTIRFDKAQRPERIG